VTDWSRPPIYSGFKTGLVGHWAYMNLCMVALVLLVVGGGWLFWTTLVIVGWRVRVPAPDEQ